MGIRIRTEAQFSGVDVTCSLRLDTVLQASHIILVIAPIFHQPRIKIM